MVNFTNHFFHTEYMPDVDKLQLAFTVGSFIYPKKIISSYAYDKQYIKMMERYKRLRRSDTKKANELLEKIMKLGKEGDVSKEAKIAGAYI